MCTHTRILTSNIINVRNGTKRNETERNGTERDGTERNGTERKWPGRDGTERNGTEWDGTERDGTERDGTGREGAIHDIGNKIISWFELLWLYAPIRIIFPAFERLYHFSIQPRWPIGRTTN